MANYFNKLKDNDFYSDKLTHIYLDGEITNTNIDKLIDDIRNANKDPKQKPILIHISSLGGSLQDGMRLMSIFNISK
jgi:ATP-dependent protease ClpP protease subunit